jgi:5-methylcytosine-specific restriction protein A
MSMPSSQPRESNRLTDAARRHEHKHRAEYSTRKWKAFRLQQLRAHPLCAYHLKRNQYVPAGIFDHVNPKDKYSLETFYRGPFQSLCKGCHDSAGQKEDKRGHIIGCDIHGVPLDPEHHWNK